MGGEPRASANTATEGLPQGALSTIRETMTTLTALARPATLLHAGTPRRGFVLGFLGTLAAGIMLLAAISIAVSLLSAGRIMPGVRVAGVEVGGLDRAAATARLEAALPSLSTGSVEVRVDGQAVQVPLAELRRSYQVSAMLDAAFGVARSGELVSDALARIRVLGVPATIPVAVTAGDSGAIDAAVADLVRRFSVPATDASVAHVAGSGFVVEEGSVGAFLDADKVRAALLSVAEGGNGQVAPIAVGTEAIVPTVTDREALAAARSANNITALPLALTAGSQSFSLAPDALVPLVSFRALPDGSYAAVIDEAAVAALVEPLASEVAAEPSNAAFEWGAGGITRVLPAVEGRELDVASSVSAIAQTLRDRGTTVIRRSVPLAVLTTAPALTTEVAQAAAAQMRVLSSWTTYYVPGENNSWNANIHIPAWDLDGYTLAPGEWFSFWNGIGPVTVARGYGYGGVIINGRSFPTGALAGGICSTSTTLFNAAMRSGLEIGERVNHSYYIERYPVGLDATVLKTDTSVTDMTFRNDTANPIVIRSYTGSGWVRFDVWGVPDGRTVSLSAPTTSNHRAARDTVVVDSSMAPGTARRVEFPHNGFYAVVTRTVRAADGSVLHSDVWESNYRVVNGETRVGPERQSGGGGGGGDDDGDD
jgi:vancomycin resistance protein YoaR